MKKTFATPLMVAAMLGLSACGVFKSHQKKTPTLGNRVPILVSENGAEADKTLADVQVLVPAPIVNEAWTQSAGDSDKTLGNLALGDQPKRAWQARIDGGSNRQRLGAAPVVAENKLFVVDVDARLHAFAADTGASLWSKELPKGEKNRSARFGGGVSYDDNKVFATDGLGEVVAFNAADGNELWRAKPGGPLRGAPTVAGGQVYALTQDNQLFALDEGNGKVLWNQSASLESQGVFGVAAPAVSQGTVVAGFSSGELNAYRYENGRVLWQDALSRTSMSTSVSSLADVDADPVIDNGQVYAVGVGGRMVAIQLDTGQRLWEQNLGGISTPWLAGEWLFVVTDDARLICISRASGRVRWISQLPAFRKPKKKSGPITWFGPVMAGSRLWLTNSDGQIVAASIADGAIAQTIETKAPISLPPVVANNTLYVLDQKGQVSAYR